MTIKTVGIQSPGDMGHAVGQVLGSHGCHVITCLEDRSTRTRALAERANIEGVPSDIHLEEDRAKAVSQADVVICATTSTEPAFPGSALRTGTFVASVGTHAPDTREIDTETIKRASTHVIDSRTDCQASAGDLQIPYKEGALNLDEVIEIADLVAGRSIGRHSGISIGIFRDTCLSGCFCPCLATESNKAN